MRKFLIISLFFYSLCSFANARILWYGDPHKPFTESFRILNRERGEAGTATVANDPVYGKIWKINKPAGSKRTEFSRTATDSGEGYTIRNGDRVYVGWRVKVNVAGNKKPKGGFAIFQLKTRGNLLQNHPVSIDYNASKELLNVQGIVPGKSARERVGPRKISFAKHPMKENTWTTIVLGFNFSKDAKVGFVEAWINGKKKNLLNQNDRQQSYHRTHEEGLMYFKWGAYNEASRNYDITVSMGDMRIGTTLASVMDHLEGPITPPTCILSTDQTWTWQTLDCQGKPTGRHETAFVEVDGLFYLIGGREANGKIDRFNPKTLTWDTMKAQSPLIHHFQPVVLDGKIWMVGAMTGTYPTEPPMTHIQIYDPKVDVWTEGPEIPKQRRRGSAGTVVYNGKIYMVGGITFGHTSGTNAWFDVFDPATNTWEQLPDAPHIRDHFHAVVLNDKLYCIGGRNTSYRNPANPGNRAAFFGAVIREIDVYDFKTGTWSVLKGDSGLPQGSAAGGTAVLGDCIVYFGGENAEEALSGCWAFDPKTKTWKQLASLNQGRHGSQAIVFDNRIYIAAGSPRRGGGRVDSIEMFSSSLAGDHTKQRVTDELSAAELSAIQDFKQRLAEKDQGALAEYNRLIKSADEALLRGPYSVTDKTGVPASGDKRDYYSLAPYWWPNPETPDGLPWIRKDGRVNPQTRSNYTDFERMGQCFGTINTLSRAYSYSENNVYAEKAVQLLDTWFINPETRMNPNMNFGQAVPGLFSGRPFGIFEMGRIGGVINSVKRLKSGNALPRELEIGFKTWLTDYSHWLETSELGIGEINRPNNHGTRCDLQRIAILTYLGRINDAKEILKEVPHRRIARQIEPDGRMLHELGRTKSWNYTTMNLRALTQLARLGNKYGVDLWNYETPDGRSIKKAYEYVASYLDGDKKWEYKQLGGMTENRLAGFARSLLRVGHEFNEESFIAIAKKYLEPDNEPADNK